MTITTNDIQTCTEAILSELFEEFAYGETEGTVLSYKPDQIDQYEEILSRHIRHLIA